MPLAFTQEDFLVQQMQIGGILNKPGERRFEFFTKTPSWYYCQIYIPKKLQFSSLFAPTDGVINASQFEFEFSVSGENTVCVYQLCFFPETERKNTVWYTQTVFFPKLKT